MPMLEDAKKIAEKVTGWARPSRANLSALVRERKASTIRFKDDGIIPNHPKWPLVIYRGAVRLPKNLDPAVVFEELFESNGWGGSWRNGIYDYVHPEGLRRGRKVLAARSEEDIYAALGLPFIEPELREGRGEIERAMKGKRPPLVTCDR